MAKTYRIKDGFDERLERIRIGMIVKTRENVTEAEILHALLLKHLEKITPRDVLHYKQWIEDRDMGLSPEDIAGREQEEFAEDYYRENQPEEEKWPDEPIGS